LFTSFAIVDEEDIINQKICRHSNEKQSAKLFRKYNKVIFNDDESYWRVKLEEEENSTNYPIRWERTEKRQRTNEIQFGKSTICSIRIKLEFVSNAGAPNQRPYF
jgi:hypothetical protein